MDGTNDVVREFLVESHESLDQLDQDLVALEEDASDPDRLGSIFRTIHSIKGTCGFLAFQKLESISHSGENLLSRMRDGELLLNAEITTGLLTLVDAIRDILREIEETGQEGNCDYSHLVNTLNQLNEGNVEAGSEAIATSQDSATVPEKASTALSIYERLGGNNAIASVIDAFYERVLRDPQLQSFFKEDRMPWLKERQAQFLSQALGGPVTYQGRPMKEAHAHLAIESKHFDRVAEHLLAVLQQMGVGEQLIDEIVAIIKPLKGDIVSVGVTDGIDEDSPEIKALLDEVGWEEDDASSLAGHPEEPAETIKVGELLVESGKVGPDDVAAALEQQQKGDPRHVGEILVEKHAVESKDVTEALTTQKTRQEKSGRAIAESSIRIDVDLLDKLMNQVGELVLVRNQILQSSNSLEDSTMNAASQKLNLITSELQEGVMKTRMQPIGNVWSKFPRVVRDLAVSCGKQITLKMEGEETELDKTLIEAIKDPLTHIVRNSADHGIEPPDERAASGKTHEGQILLRAYHEGGQVNIEISDDGRGMDVERIKHKAVDKGLISSSQATQMNDREALNLVFMPGFSTAEKVTNVSGRGVGMDVVRTNIEKIGGTVDLQSQVGRGSTVKIKIPLTLAIIPALIIKTSGDYYAIPQISLVELVRLEGEGARAGIESIYGAPVYRLRDKLLPLIYLNKELKLEDDAVEQGDDDEEAAVNIVVLQADDRQFGLVVDDINDTEEIVVKPLSRHLKHIPIYAGATIMGDGTVALILDALGIAQSASVVTEVQDRNLVAEEEQVTQEDDERATLLLFSGLGGSQLAIPLDSVSRLEAFPRDSIETAGNQQVVQYRNQILPLVHISTLLPERRKRKRVDSEEDSSQPASTENETVHVVVCAEGDRVVGLIVDRINDILEHSLRVKREATRECVLYSVVIQDRVTELLDVKKVIDMGAVPVTENLAMAAEA